MSDDMFPTLPVFAHLRKTLMEFNALPCFLQALFSAFMNNASCYMWSDFMRGNYRITECPESN